MGMDLSGAGGYFRWNFGEWGDLLELAQAYGWKPMGTGPPRGMKKAEWGEGTYFSNEGQLFYARDAKALADALERAVLALANETAANQPAKVPKTRKAHKLDHFLAAITGKNKPKKGRIAVQSFSPKDLLYICGFIDYCREGSFRIY